MKTDDPNDGAIRVGEPPYFGNATRGADGRDSDMTKAANTNRSRRYALWNSFSVSAPFVGFVCGVVAGVCAPHMQWVEWGFRVWLAFAVVGLLAGVIALVRAERWWGLTLAGFILNTVVVWFIHWSGIW